MLKVGEALRVLHSTEAAPVSEIPVASEPAPDACPLCGKLLVHGSLRARGPTGIVWRQSAPSGKTLDEDVISKSGVFFCTLPAGRCPDCRLVVSSY